VSKADDKLKRALRCIEDAEKHQKELATEWARFYDVYLGKPSDKSRWRKLAKWKSKLFVKHAFQQVETLLPEFLVEEPNFEVLPREQSDEARAKTVQKLLDYQLDRDRYSEKRMQAVKKAIIFGACPIKVTWAYEVRRMRVRNPITPEESLRVLAETGELPPPSVEQDVVLHDDPTMVVVDPFDFMWDPAATSIDDAQYVLHRSWLTDEQLEAKVRAGIYSGLDEVLEGTGDDRKGGGSSGGFWSRLTGESTDQAQARRGDRHEVIEKWTRDRLVVIVNRKVIARDVENPYWHGQIPFVMAVTQPDVDKMVGLSEVWSIEALQEAIWLTQNAQYDALRLTLDPPIFMEERDPRLKEFMFEPGARGFTSNPKNNISVADIGQANAYASGQEVDRMRAEMERVSGINASVAGSSNEGTATEAAMNLRQGKSRIALKMACIDRAFARAAEQFIALDQQFIDADRVLRIVGEGAEWETVSAQDIAGAFDVRPRNSTERTMKELAREQSLNLLGTFAQFTGLGVNVWPLIDKVAEAHGIAPDLLRPAEGSQPAQTLAGGPTPEQAMAEQQMQQAANVDGLDDNGFAPDALTGG
jgi:hypothetical protein